MTSDIDFDADQIWRDPDGNPLIITGVSYLDRNVTVKSAEQDANGRWHPVDGTRRTVPEQWLRSACTFQPPAPEPPDPRIARLSESHQ